MYFGIFTFFITFAAPMEQSLIVKGYHQAR